MCERASVTKCACVLVWRMKRLTGWRRRLVLLHAATSRMQSERKSESPIHSAEEEGINATTSLPETTIKSWPKKSPISRLEKRPLQVPNSPAFIGAQKNIWVFGLSERASEREREGGRRRERKSESKANISLLVAIVVLANKHILSHSLSPHLTSPHQTN